MSGRFRVGDVCVGQNHAIETYRNGMECIVTEVVFNKPVRGRTTRILYEAPISYRVVWADGEKSRQRPHKLRLRRPPTWDQWIFDTKDVEREAEYEEKRESQLDDKPPRISSIAEQNHWDAQLQKLRDFYEKCRREP